MIREGARTWKDSAPTSQFKLRATCNQLRRVKDLLVRMPVRWSLRLLVSSDQTNSWLQLWIKPMLSMQSRLKTRNSRDLILRFLLNRHLKHNPKLNVKHRHNNCLKLYIRLSLKLYLSICMDAWHSIFRKIAKVNVKTVFWNHVTTFWLSMGFSG